MGINLFDDGSFRIHVGVQTNEIDIVYTIERGYERMVFYIMLKDRELIADVFAEVLYNGYSKIETYSENWTGHPTMEEFYKKHYVYKDYVSKLKDLYNNLDLDLIRVNHALLGVLGIQKDYTVEELKSVIRRQ